MSTTETSTKSAYTQGHTETILTSHARRTVANSAAYLEPHLDSSQWLLDVGCGPGSITLDFASRVSEVVGIDSADKAVEAAKKALGEKGVRNVNFQVGDVMKLDFADATFDVVHAHQVIMYLPPPRSTALREMRRVTKPGGLVAICDGDFGTIAIHPPSPALEKWKKLFYAVMKHNRGEADSGRRLLSYALDAGWKREDVEVSTSTWCYSTPEKVKWWGATWADRVLTSSLGTTAVENGIATKEELEDISKGWLEWAEAKDAWFGLINGQILCRC